MRTVCKHILFVIAVIFAGWLSLELLFFAFSVYCCPQNNLENYVLPAGFITNAAQRYNRDVGWKYTYSTVFGERPRARTYPTDLLSAFGDSFTHCNEVSDNETWEEYLSLLAGKNVYNFGVGGYGPDQAYLNFIQTYPRIRTPIVTFGLVDDDINRLVNVYRPFLDHRQVLPFTKPRFELRDGRLVLFSNPISSREQLSLLCGKEFIATIGKSDYWYNETMLFNAGFPRVRILCDKRLWKKILDRCRGRCTLWQFKEKRELLYAVLDQFVADAKQQGAIPVILFFPTRLSLSEDEAPPNASYYIADYCSKKGYLYFDGNKVFREAIERGGRLNGLFAETHLSPKGNKLIAEAFFGYLRAQGLIKKASQVSAFGMSRKIIPERTQ